MPFLRDEQNRMIRKDGSLVENAQRGRARGKGSRVTELPAGRVSHLKVDKILGGAGPLRDEYERLVEDPNTLLKQLQAWFLERGYGVNLTAINRHRHRHLQQFQRVRDQARTAAAFCETVRKAGPAGAMIEAAQGHFEMKLMQEMSDLADRAGDGKPADAQQFNRWGRTLASSVATRKTLDAMRVEYERRAREAAEAMKAQLDPTEQNARVVERVREILGV